jgi:hypothetical protein
MRGKNLVKICTIAGFILAEIYMVWVVLAPHSPGKARSMFVPEMMIPKERNVAPGTQPPLSAKLTRLAVLAFFFGPFGAMAGCGIGLLADGVRRKFQGGGTEEQNQRPGEGGTSGGAPPSEHLPPT